VTDIALVVLLTSVDVAAGPVIVESTTTCPTAAEVEARLQALLPPATEGTPRRRAKLASEDGALHVYLAALDGTPLGDRTLAVEASCADRANVAAVVIAAWEAQQRAEEVQAPSLPRRPAPAPAVVVAPAPEPPPPPRVTVEVTAGPAATLTGRAVSPTLALAVEMWGQRVGARLGLFGLAPRTETLGAGSARWTRVGGTLELGVRARGPAGRLDAHGGLVAAGLMAQGSGFDVDHRVTGFVPGLGAGVDLSRAFGHAVVGLGAFAAGFVEQSLVDTTTGSRITRALPRFQVSLDAHAGFVF
jgi:hypothetical protein